MNWQEVESVFEWDGSLLDLYVLNTDIEDWQSALDFLRTSGYPLFYAVNNIIAELPTDVAAIFRVHEEANVWLRIDASGITILCHFFTDEEIEFDIDPREVSNEEQFGYLCGFVRGLGQYLNRSVILTPESTQETVIIRYLPSEDQFVYTPLPLWTPIGTIP